MSAPGEAPTHDSFSFRSGLTIAWIDYDVLHASLAAEEYGVAHQLLFELTSKHIGLLERLKRERVGTDKESSTEVKELSEELTRLKYRHAALTRKYQSLARSKLGRLTLRIWERRRSGAQGFRKNKRPTA